MPCTRKRHTKQRSSQPRVRRRKKRTQRGSALARHKPRLVDKIAKGVSMFLSGPTPSFVGVRLKLGSQAFKGIKDNVDYYRRRKRRRPFLNGILKEANRFKRQDLLQHANRDQQINAVSEMVLNLLKKRIPIDARTYGKLKRHKNLLREVGRRKNLVKCRREHLIAQSGSGFWSGLHDCFRACWARR